MALESYGKKCINSAIGLLFVDLSECNIDVYTDRLSRWGTIFFLYTHTRTRTRKQKYIQLNNWEEISTLAKSIVINWINHVSRLYVGLYFFMLPPSKWNNKITLCFLFRNTDKIQLDFVHLFTFNTNTNTNDYGMQQNMVLVLQMQKLWAKSKKQRER